MTKTDELLKEFADQEYPLYGSRMDEHREEMRKALIVRLRTLIAQVEEDRMPSDEDRDIAALEYTNNDDMIYEQIIFENGWDACRNRMKGKE